MESDLELAFQLVDAADAETLRRWCPSGVASTSKADGTPVTEADVAAEQAMLGMVRGVCPNDGFLGEELGQHPGTSGRRWIADGVDGTRFFAAGHETWGTLLALEVDGEIVLGVCSSPAQNRRWWAARGAGAFAAGGEYPVSECRFADGAKSRFTSSTSTSGVPLAIGPPSSSISHFRACCRGSRNAPTSGH